MEAKKNVLILACRSLGMNVCKNILEENGFKVEGILFDKEIDSNDSENTLRHRVRNAILSTNSQLILSDTWIHSRIFDVLNYLKDFFSEPGLEVLYFTYLEKGRTVNMQSLPKSWLIMEKIQEDPSLLTRRANELLR